MEPYTIESVGVRSLSLLLGTMALGWGVIIALVWVAIGVQVGMFPGLPELLAVLVGAPIGGLIVGAIAAILFNLAVVLVGGLEVEMER